MSKTLTIEDVELQIRKLGDQVDSLGRKVGDLSRQVETMDEDRAILEDIQRAIRSLEESTKVNTTHIDTLFKAVKLEVQVQGQRTEDQMEAVKDKVEEHVGNLVENIEKKKVIVIQETLLKRVKKFFERR